MGNPFVHVELMSTNVGKAKAFYGKLFDWKLEDVNMGNMTYTMIKVGEGTGGGLMSNPIPGADSMWVTYVSVDDLKAATAKAKSLGATVLKEQVEIKGGGSFSIITDLGLRFPVPSEKVLEALGYRAVDAVPLPAALVQRIPAGPTLDPAAALHVAPALP